MGTKGDKKEKIIELEKIAKEVKDLKNKSRPRRPIVIEFCGSPKSGKTSAINSLNIFLKRNKFKTKVMTERASSCPINDKFNPLFNIWTSCSAIAELATYLSNNPKDIDIIIADRGIFDAICWFYWQTKHNHLDEGNFKSLINFLTMEKWRRVFDFIYVFTAIPEKSLEREYANLLTREFGRVMNPTILNEFNDSINDVVRDYSSYFRKVEKIDTSKSRQDEVGYEVTKCTLEILKEIIMEQIGYLEISDLEEFKANDTIDWEQIMKKELKMKYGLREVVESDHNLVQPLPIIVFTNKERNKVLAFKKNPKSLSSKSPEMNKILLYAGGHIRKEDCIDVYESNSINNQFMSIVKATLSREISEELGISHYPHENAEFLILIKGHPISKKHLAICFLAEVDIERFNFRLNKDEFIQKLGRTKSGTFMDIAEVEKRVDDLDSWSAIILKRIFGIGLSKQKQLSLNFLD